MKKITITLIISIFSLFTVFAHPGGLDKNGGHYCRKNCAKWGLKTGEYHCHRAGCKLK